MNYEFEIVHESRNSCWKIQKGILWCSIIIQNWMIDRHLWKPKLPDKSCVLVDWSIQLFLSSWVLEYIWLFLPVSWQLLLVLTVTFSLKWLDGILKLLILSSWRICLVMRKHVFFMLLIVLSNWGHRRRDSWYESNEFRLT